MVSASLAVDPTRGLPKQALKGERLDDIGYHGDSDGSAVGAAPRRGSIRTV